MVENETEKWARVQGKCAIASLALAVLGLPPAWYCAYSVFKSGSPAGSRIMTPTHFDIAFISLVCFYLAAIIAGIVWFTVRLKRRKFAIAALQLQNGEVSNRAEQPALSPLQAEILQLIRDLREYRISLGVRSEMPAAKPIREGDDVQTILYWQNEEVTLWTQHESEWIRKFIYGYRDRFVKRVERVMNLLGSDGLVVAALEPFAHDPRPNFNFKSLLDVLGGFILRLEESKEERKAALEFKAQESLAKLVPVQLGPPLPEIFTPLQIEAFTLAKDLREFFRGLGPRPVMDKALLDGTAVGYAKGIEELNPREMPWIDALTYGYQLRFKDRVPHMRDRLGEKGLKSQVFADVEHLGINNVDTVPNLAREIDRLALVLNYHSLVTDGLKVKRQ